MSTGRRDEPFKRLMTGSRGLRAIQAAIPMGWHVEVGFGYSDERCSEVYTMHMSEDVMSWSARLTTTEPWDLPAMAKARVDAFMADTVPKYRVVQPAPCQATHQSVRDWAARSKHQTQALIASVAQTVSEARKQPLVCEVCSTRLVVLRDDDVHEVGCPACLIEEAKRAKPTMSDERWHAMHTNGDSTKVELHEEQWRSVALGWKDRR